MTIDQVLTLLSAAANAVALGDAAQKLYRWLSLEKAKKTVDPGLVAELSKLSLYSDSSQIIRVLSPIFVARGGDVLIEAGHNGGGSVAIEGQHLKAGDGRNGGDVVIRAGDGGALGAGGNIHITGGTIKGGNAV